MEIIKRFIDCYIPTETCNLRCHYCYIALQRKFNNKLVSFSHTKEEIRKALSKERLGGTCLLNFCAGGETLLSEDVLEVVYELLDEGHFVMIVTNGTISKRFEEISKWPEDILKRLFLKLSFHYLELKRLNMLEVFVKNVLLMKKKKVSFTIEITPSDELISYIDEIKDFCLQHFGAYCHVTIARDDRTNGIDVLSDMSYDEYKKLWGTFNSMLFEFKSDIFYKKRNEFCYAGEWSAYLNLETGRMTQCYCGKELDNIYKNLCEPLRFEAIGYGCSLPHCYNGHAFLTLGDIPEINSPMYAEVRNRVCADGSEWLTPNVKEFMSHKLIENNREYSLLRKKSIKVKYIAHNEYKKARRIAGKIKRMVLK